MRHKRDLSQTQIVPAAAAVLLKEETAAMKGTSMKRNRERGQSLALVAVAMFVLLAILGFAIDFGYYRYVRRQLQNAADAAALAGAMEITYGDVTTAGQDASAENGFSTATPGISVVISNPPATGVFAGSSYKNYVQAVVTDSNVPTFFSRIFNGTAPTLSATAVAEGGVDCLYGLDTASGALTLSAYVLNIACGVVDDDNLVLNGGVLCAPSIALVGSETGGGGLTCSGTFFNQARPVHLNSPVVDPLCPNLANCMAAPSPATLPTCTGTKGVYKVTNVNSGPTITSALTLTAGYCGGISISGSGSTSPVIFSPGNYYGPITISNSVVTFDAGTYAINIPTSSTSAGIAVQNAIFAGSTVKFQAGTYTIAGGISDDAGLLGFGSNMDFDSTAGSTQSLIILYGGGLHLSGSLFSGLLGGGSIAKSTGGITFYNTGSGSGTCSTCYGQIVSSFNWSSTFCGSTCGMTASTSGSTPGILFFQDRNDTSVASCPFGGTGSACFGANINLGSGLVSHTGTYYFPTGAVNFNFDFGQGATWTYLIAKDVKWFLGFTFNYNYPALPTSFPLRQGSAVLVQ